VLADGNLQLDGTVVTEEQLTAKLAAARTPLTEPTVVIHGDAKCPFQNVAEALGACRQAGISELGITVRIASAGATTR
jgi:biopolymer transport protein ExbD